jgi:hypothetical protein
LPKRLPNKSRLLVVLHRGIAPILLCGASSFDSLIAIHRATRLCFILFFVGPWLVARGSWPLAGGWWLVAGGWWLVAGGWWLVARGFWFKVISSPLFGSWLFGYWLFFG